jgi:transmembrane sensor
MNRGPSFSSETGLPEPGRPMRPLDWARAAGAEDLVEREMRAQLRRRQRRMLATGAAALAVLVAGFLWQSRPVVPLAALPTAPAFVTAPARQVLPDGSIVELKEAARMTVDYAGPMRRVVLHQGEAHFEVAKNPNRPFIVIARGVEVRAVGTAFAVALSPANVGVLVTEGRVAIDARPLGAGAASAVPAASPEASKVVVDAGQCVTVETVHATLAISAVTPVPERELAERLAWRVPTLELNFTPLEAVLPVVNTHSTARLRLAQPELGSLQLSGSLRANNLPVLLQILESSYGVKAEHTPHGEIVLHR